MGSVISQQPQESPRQAGTVAEGAEIVRGTLREPAPGGYTPQEAPQHPHEAYMPPQGGPGAGSTCPKCGYPVSAGATECPVCHASIGAQQTPQSKPSYNTPRPAAAAPRPGVGTINPWAAPAADAFFTLQRIPWQTETVAYDPVSYSGAEIVLNRANTDANNSSITSREQAVISNEGGDWYIENRSELGTTLLRVDRKMKLEDGDIIVLGNRMFEFRKG